jgi:hypothetical protein
VHVEDLVDNRCLYRQNDDNQVGQIRKNESTRYLKPNNSETKDWSLTKDCLTTKKECTDRLSLEKRKKKKEVSERDTWGLSAQHDRAWH